MDLTPDSRSAGAEGFVVRMEDTGVILASVTIDAVPGTWLTRLGGPKLSGASHIHAYRPVPRAPYRWDETIMWAMVTLDRIAEYRQVIHSVADWAVRQEDIVGVAVVGSWARDHERMDSDVDLVILTDNKDRYLSDSSWVRAAVGTPAEILATEDWGPLTERRIVLPSGLEIEFGFAPRSWALVDPLDVGTARVVRNGCSPLVDPEGAFARLIAAIGAPP